MEQALWIVGVFAVVVLLPVACYVCTRAISMAHYSSKLDYELKRRKLGV
jgi:uncharacterized membrane protein